MKAYQCDICKGLFIKTKYLCIRTLEVVHMNSALAYQFDICPDCIAAIQKTIDERSGGGSSTNLDGYISTTNT